MVREGCITLFLLAYSFSGMLLAAQQDTLWGLSLNPLLLWWDFMMGLSLLQGLLDGPQATRTACTITGVGYALLTLVGVEIRPLGRETALLHLTLAVVLAWTPLQHWRAKRKPKAPSWPRKVGPA